MTFRNKKLISYLLFVLIMVPTVFFSTPKKTEAWGLVWDIPTEIATAKEVIMTILAQLIMVVEKRLLQEITKSTVNWINSGNWGNPLFVENPDSFFKDIAKFEVKNLVDLFGYNSLKYPFGKDFSLNLINSYKAKLEDNAQYSLSKVINDPTLLNNYRNNFAYGGWNGFLINTQYPQNNYLGFRQIALENLARKLQGTAQTATQKVQTTLEQGMGFLSPQICETNTAYNSARNEFQQPKFDYTKYQKDHPYDFDASRTDPLYDIKYMHNLNNQELEWGTKNACPPRADGSSGFVTTTPGGVVANQINQAMGSQFRKSELAGALGSSISSIVDAFLNHFLDKGLSALKNKANPPPPVDTWNYYGQTLGGSATPNTTTTGTTPSSLTASVIDFDHPTSVPSISVSNGRVVNILMKGGTPPYNIQTEPDMAMAVGYISASENLLMITGTSTTSGQTSIILEDSSGKTISLEITATGANTSLTQPPIGSGDNFTCTPDENGVLACTTEPGGGGGGNVQCLDPNGQYEGSLRTAMDAVLSENPEVADLPNIEAGGRVNARKFLKLVETKLQSMGFNATVEVRNGNGNPNSGDAIALWKNGDSKMERYDAIIGNDRNVQPIKNSTQTDFTGLISLTCTDSGGGRGNDCKCEGAPTPPTPGGTTGPVPITQTDLTGATIVNAPSNVLSWPQTTTITSVTLNPGLTVDFTKKNGSNRWPDQYGGPGIAATDTIQYTVWFFVKVNGKWIGSAFIQSWYGRDPLTDKPITAAFAMQDLWYARDRWGDMYGHNASGEQVGIMVTSGNSRNGGVPQFKERSNIVTFTMP